MKAATVNVLGSGTCYPEPCQTKRAHPGFFIRYGENPEEHLLLECSAGIAERLEAIGIKTDEIEQMAISHAHPDHFALPQFIQSAHCAHCVRSESAAQKTTPTLKLFVPSHIKNSLMTLNAIHFEETCAVTDQLPGLAFPIITATCMSNPPNVRMRAFLAGDAVLTAFTVHHGFGKVDAVAFRLEVPNGPTIAYSGDTGMCYGVIQAAKQADLFICEASARVGNNDSATKYGHLNPFQAGQVAKLANVKSLLLTHYSGCDSDTIMMSDCLLSSFKGNVTIAKDGLSIKV